MTLTVLTLHLDHRIWWRNGNTYVHISQSECLTGVADVRLTVVMNHQVRDLLRTTGRTDVQLVCDPVDPEQLLVVPDGSNPQCFETFETDLLAAATRHCTGYMYCAEAYAYTIGWGRRFEELPVPSVCIMDWASKYHQAFWLMEQQELLIPRSKAAELLLRHRWAG